MTKKNETKMCQRLLQRLGCLIEEYSPFPLFSILSFFKRVLIINGFRVYFYRTIKGGFMNFELKRFFHGSIRELLSDY